MSLAPVLQDFHPAVAAWFARAFPAPTPAQHAAWPPIRAGRHVLVAAPTGSGKTLTAFLSAIDALVRQGLDGTLQDGTQVVYVSPLKALSNDIHVNLEAPLEGIRAELARMGLPDVGIRTAVRTGDTPQSERAALRRQPPHILVTTPESLYVLLGSESGRAMLGGTRTVIVDEIHAMVSGKRGSHLALSLERLEALCGRRLARIGLSATQKPIEQVARFLVGAPNVAADGTPDCAVLDIGYDRPRDLALEMTAVPLQPVMSNEHWDLVYARLAGLVESHRTTLVFVNTRRMAERAARHLAERLGREHVAAHHGSLSKELRFDAEQRLKQGRLKVLVATASLELGIDIGDVDLVCQLGSPRSIAAFLQRVGRSGHFVGGVPKGRLFPTTREELVECAALLDCVRRGELDALVMPPAPLDVLAQQVVAEVSCGEWEEDALHALVRRAWPYATLSRKDFDDVVRMLAEGYATRRGTRAALIHRDAVHGRLRGRKGGRLTALTSGGTIPDTGDYQVILEPQSILVGSVNEDFAIDSMRGDIFQLGNTSYRIVRVEAGRIRVEDAQGLPPNLPFWLGEAPGRTDELSVGVSRLRDAVARAFARGGADAAYAWLVDEAGLLPEAARQLVEFVGGQVAATGTMPTRDRIVLERFFDESGGTQLVVHSPYGSRVNRAWGLALRKRFCRKFNFELQAAATEDAIVLSLSTSHSFPLLDVSRYLHSSSGQDVLVQALLDAPLFPARWRWNATTALALPRFSGGRKVAPQLQRMRSEDLLATVFPDQVACAENLAGEREVPDHPLVAQTLDDCLHEAMDADGWLALLRRMEAGTIEVVACDLTAPSPFAAEALTARPYAFLDDAPLEERRTHAVMARGHGDPVADGDLGRLDPGAIDDVREQAWPRPRTADEMHEVLMGLGAVTGVEAIANPKWPALLEVLAGDRRATRLAAGRADLWVAAERLPQLLALFPEAAAHPAVSAPPALARAWEPAEALVELLRGRLSALGPVTPGELAGALGLRTGDVDAALLRLEGEGYAMRGRFSPGATGDQWCERHLLARIHRATLGRLRREIEPVAPRDFMRFLCDWQRVTRATRVNGPEALAGVLSQLEGFEAPAAAWEGDLLPARVADYSITWLDDLCTAGRVAWARLRGATASDGGAGRTASVRTTPVVVLPRRQLPLWSRLAASRHEEVPQLSSRAEKVVAFLGGHGASFFDEMVGGAQLLRAELEDALAELVARGRVHCDSFAGLRALLVPASRRGVRHARRGRRMSLHGLEDAGRWSLTRSHPPDGGDAAAAVAAADVEHIARVLLRRYGVVGWRLLEREAAWLPPWRDLLRVYRRLEARGEIRGGRFVEGVSGEQFALPEAIGAMRQVRRRAPDGELVVLAAQDPLNLVGTLLPGVKVPRLPGARVAWRDGLPVASLVAGKVEVAGEADDAERRELRRVLLREPASVFDATAAPAPLLQSPTTLQ